MRDNGIGLNGLSKKNSKGIYIKNNWINISPSFSQMFHRHLMRKVGLVLWLMLTAKRYHEAVVVRWKNMHYILCFQPFQIMRAISKSPQNIIVLNDIE